MPIQFDSGYDTANHWRLTVPGRSYKTHVVVYNDHIIEPGSYDTLEYCRGYKWQLATKFLNTFDHTQYQYIGFFDHDIVTDVDNIERAFQEARKYKLKLFQMSLDSRNPTKSLPHLTQRSNSTVRKIQYVEGMAPIFHTSIIPVLKALLNFYSFKVGWGLDNILPYVIRPITKSPLGVIDAVKMLHKPLREEGKLDHSSTYNKDQAAEEYWETCDVVLPQFMKHYYNIDQSPLNAWNTSLTIRNNIIGVRHPIHGEGKVLQYNKDSRGLVTEYIIKFKNGTRAFRYFDLVGAGMFAATKRKMTKETYE